MPCGVPVIKVSDDADPIRSGRPHGKTHAALAFMSATMRAKLLVNSFVFTLTEEVEIDVAERGRKFRDGVGSPTVREGISRDRALAYARASDTLRRRAFA